MKQSKAERELHLTLYTRLVQSVFYGTDNISYHSELIESDIQIWGSSSFEIV